LTTYAVLFVDVDFNTFGPEVPLCRRYTAPDASTPMATVAPAFKIPSPAEREYSSPSGNPAAIASCAAQITCIHRMLPSMHELCHCINRPATDLLPCHCVNAPWHGASLPHALILNSDTCLLNSPLISLSGPCLPAPAAVRIF